MSMTHAVAAASRMTGISDSMRTRAWTPAEKVMLKIRRDEVWRDKGLTHFDDAVRRYFGPAYDPGMVQGAQSDPFNSAFGYISNTLPRLAFANPKVRIGSIRRGPFQFVAKAEHHYVNRWIKDVSFYRLLEEVGTDYLFNWGMTGIMMEQRPGFQVAGQPTWWPQVFRVPQRQAGFDYTATSWQTKKHSWHQTIEELEIMREIAREDAKLPKDEQEGWDLRAIEQLSVGSGISEARPELDGQIDSDIREPVAYYTFWNPRGKVDPANSEEKGFYGTLITVGYNAAGESAFIKPEADYFGPARGPHNLWGTYTVPNRPWPLAALVATWEQQRELNSIANANNKSARNYKRMALADDPDLVELIKSGRHDYAFYHEGLDTDRVMELKIAGLDAQMQNQEVRLQEVLDENLGITETMRGNVSGDATATESAIASAAAGTRQGYTAKKFIDAMLVDLRGVLHYGLKDDRIYAMLGSEAAEDMQMREPVYVGGDNTPVEDFEMTVEVSSMQYTSAEQDKRSAFEMIDLVERLASQAVNSPFLIMPTYIDMIADPSGHPELARIFDHQVLQETRDLLAQQALSVPQEQAQPTFRVGKAQAPTRELRGGGGRPKQLQPQSTTSAGPGSSAQAQRPQQLIAGGAG